LTDSARNIHETGRAFCHFLGCSFTLEKIGGGGVSPDIKVLSLLQLTGYDTNRDEIADALKGADLVFITCGLGGGTGSGASPIIADAAHDVGALAIAVVTKPFLFEGKKRAAIAEEALVALRDRVDTLITIPNDKVLNLIDKNTSIVDAFNIIDDILKQGVQGIADLITYPGIVNVDFADIKVIMSSAGSALMGIGRATGEDRAAAAAKAAINSPLLDISINGARGILFNVSGGVDLGMNDINEAAKVITESIDSEAKVIFGATHDSRLKKGEVKVTVVATGFDTNKYNGSGNGNNQVVSHVLSPYGRSSEGGENSLPPKKPAVNIEIIDEEEWDMPAFIRRKKDKDGDDKK